MSRLTDLAIKKLAMRKEAAVLKRKAMVTEHFPYTIPDADRLGVMPFDWGDLYSTNNYNYGVTNDPSPFYPVSKLKEINSVPNMEQYERNIRPVRQSPLYPHNFYYATPTGYPDSEAFRTVLSQTPNPGELTHVFDPLQSRITYKGSSLEKRDRLIRQGLDNVKKRDQMSDAALGGLGGSVMGRLHSKSQSKK